MSASKIIMALLVAISSFETFAVEQRNSINNIEQKIFGVELGATRIIYNPNGSYESLRVKNNNEYPVIIQSNILNEDKKSKSDFIVTPPVQRINPGDQTRLRVIFTGNKYPRDKESLHWLCIKGVPPILENSHSNDKSDISVDILTSNCIKVLIRPGEIPLLSIDRVINKDVKYFIRDKNIVIENKSPYFINISKLTINKKNIDIGESYIRPYSLREYHITNIKNENRIELSILDDYGAEIQKRLFLKG